MSQQLVSEIKAKLVAQGVDLSGPCGAFQITKRVAWALRHEGYGLLGGKSPGQNGCTVNGERYAVEWVLKADGHGADILIDAGGDNGPTWREEEADPKFYRPAIDPGDAPTPPGPIEPIPDPLPHPLPDPVPPVDLGPILSRLADAETRLAQHDQRLADLAEVSYYVEGGTGKAWGHAHQVLLTVKKGPR